jgi:hypothetical protein
MSGAVLEPRRLRLDVAARADPSRQSRFTFRLTVQESWVGNTPGGIIGRGHDPRDDGWPMSSVMVDCPK